MEWEQKNANPKEDIESIVVQKLGIPMRDTQSYKKIVKQWFVS